MKSKTLGVSVFIFILTAWIFSIFLKWFSARENTKFLAAFDDINNGQSIMSVTSRLGTEPIYDLKLTPDNEEFIKASGLRSLPSVPDSVNSRVIVYPWRGPPVRFIFIFYNQHDSNVVAKAYGKP